MGDPRQRNQTERIIATTKNQRRPPELGLYVNYSQIFFQKARDSDMEHFLATIPRDHALKFFCGLSAIVHNFRSGSFLDLQRGVVNELSTGNLYARRIIEKLVKPNAFITPEQLAVLQKFSIMYCCPEGSILPSDFSDRLLRVMLAYNSLRGLEDLDRSDIKKAMLAVELRNAFSSREGLAFLIDLYWSFFKWATSVEGKASNNSLDVAADFQAFYGLTYLEYAAAAFSFISYYLPIKTVADLQRHNPFLNVDTFLKSFTDQRPARMWLTLNSMPMSEAKTIFERSPGPTYSGFSLQPLMERPFIHAEQNIIFPPHLPFVENRIGAGLFFALLDGYNRSDGNRKRSQQFTRFFGDFFEQRCVGMARQAHPTPDLVFGEQKYRLGKKSTDLVIFEGTNAIFIDIAAARLTMKETLIGLDERSISKDIDKIVDNAKQMTGAIAAFKAGELVYKDANGDQIDPYSIDRIYPIALIVAPIPRFFAFNRLILERLSEKQYLQDCEPFEVLSAEDFDLLMRLTRAGYLISETLMRKFSYPVPLVRGSSLKNYLSLYDNELRERANSVAWPGLGEAWYSDILETVRSWGLPIARGSIG